MFCSQCGAQNTESARYCVKCGREVTTPSTFSGTASTNQALGSSTTAAVMTPPVVTANVVPETSGKAIASMICGFFSILFPAAIAAIVLGHISRSEIKKSQGRLTGSGLALTGLIFGYTFVMIAPILIIAAIAIPNLLRSRIAANEASSVGSIRTLNVAEVTYSSTYPDLGFACSLDSLGGDGKSAEHAGLINDILASGHKSGYTFTIASCGDGLPHTTYSVVAIPNQPGTSGQRTFCSDQTGVIRMVRSGNAKDCLEEGQPL